MKKVRDVLVLLVKINWAALLSILLVIAGVTFSLLHRSDVAISMGLGAIAMAHLAHLADKEPPRA